VEVFVVRLGGRKVGVGWRSLRTVGNWIHGLRFVDVLDLEKCFMGFEEVSTG